MLKVYYRIVTLIIIIFKGGYAHQKEGILNFGFILVAA